MDPTTSSEADMELYQQWLQIAKSAFNRRLLQGNAKPSDEQIIRFLESGDFTALITTLFSVVKMDAPMDNATFLSRFERLKATGNLPLICDDVLTLAFEVCNDEKPQKIYEHIIRLLDTLASATLTSNPSTPTKYTTSDKKDKLQKHWESPLVGNSLNTLFARIQQYEGEFKESRHYSKAIVFVQSSGAGKSRLADSVGERCPMVTYVVRDHSGGFPPCDVEILEFLTSSPTKEEKANMSPTKDVGDQYIHPGERQENIWSHALMVGLLEATFEKYHENLSKAKSSLPINPPPTFQRIAKYFHERTLPVNGSRSSDRKRFCEEVAHRAKVITSQCTGDKMFRKCFDDTSPSEIRNRLQYGGSPSIKRLFDARDKLAQALYDVEAKPGDIPLFVMVFDEVSSLLKDGENVKYIALNRLISCISNGHNIWYLFLSTETKISDLLPPDAAPLKQSVLNQPSSRGGDYPHFSGTKKRLRRFPPFTSFTVDTLDFQNKFKHKPKQETMSQFVSLRHMVIFGRPLWSAYTQSEEALGLAAAKLLGGNFLQEFDTNDENHVFAVLSVRLGLDINLANPKTLPLSQSAVHLHMRKVDWLDPSTGVMSTTTPNEPILSLAARNHLLEDSSNWADAIATLSAELLDKISVDKGLEGELYARLILTLARDHISSKLSSGDHGLIFTVKDFLKHLYTTSYHSEIDKIDKKILEASMNFLSFSPTKEILPSDKSLQSLFYLLLRRSSALQLAPLQRNFDQLLPFYMGGTDEPFDPSQTGAIVVQVKNRKRPSSVEAILEEPFFQTREASPKRKHTRQATKAQAKNLLRTSPVGPKCLFLLLDLDADKVSVKFSKSKANDPTIWAIHSCGHDEKIFRCLEDWKLRDAVRRFFNKQSSSPVESDIGFIHDKDQLYNAIYCDEIDMD